MTLEERVSRMSLQELRRELAKVRVRQMKEVVERVLPSKASERAKLFERHSLGTVEGQINTARLQMHARCSHQLHRARWIPGPFNVAGTSQWMVPCVCEKCGELVRKFVEVK